MRRKYVWQERVPSFLFAFFIVMGYSFAKTDSWDLVFGSTGHFLLSMGEMAVLYGLFLTVAGSLFEMVKKRTNRRAAVGFKNPLLSWWLDRHPFGGTILFLLAVWSPYVIAQYPAGMGHDAYSQMNQALGYIDMVAHHPPFHTFWIGYCVKLGRRLGSMNVGIFLYVLTQMAVVIGAWAYGMRWLAKRRLEGRLRLAIALFIGFFPLFPMYATTVIKDVPYGAFYLLYVIFILELLQDFRKGREVWPHLLALGISSLFLMLLRNNGIYLVIPSALGLLAAGRGIWRGNRRYFLLALACLFVPVGILRFHDGWLIPRMGIGPGSISMAFSIPFQQTGRYVRDYGEEVTQEEREIINKVLDCDALAEVYNPNLSDPLTYMYRNPEKEELAAYFQLWFRQFLKHPGVYVEATMNNVYAMFYPGVDNTVIFFDLLHEYGYNNFDQPKALAGYRLWMASFTEKILKAPILNLLNNMALWVWVFFLEFFYCWKEKRWDGLYAAIPALMTILVCIAGPAILGHPRYVFPVLLEALILLVPVLEEGA